MHSLVCVRHVSVMNKFQIIKCKNEIMHLDIASDALQIFRDDMQGDCTTCANFSPDW